MAGSRKEVYNLLTLAYGIGLYGKGVLLSRNVRNKMHAQFFFSIKRHKVSDLCKSKPPGPSCSKHG